MSTEAQTTSTEENCRSSEQCQGRQLSCLTRRASRATSGGQRSLGDWLLFVIQRQLTIPQFICHKVFIGHLDVLGTKAGLGEGPPSSATSLGCWEHGTSGLAQHTATTGKAQCSEVCLQSPLSVCVIKVSAKYTGVPHFKSLEEQK